MSKTPIVGINLEFDEPLMSELIIPVDTETVNESFARIILLLNERNQNEG